MDIFKSFGDDFLPVGQVVFDRSSIAFLLVFGNARSYMPLGQPPSRHRHIYLDKPDLVHERGGIPPGLLVQRQVIALKDDDAVCWVDGDVVFYGILFGVVKGRGVEGRGGAGQRFLGPEGLDQSVEGGAVKGEFCAAAGVGCFWIGEGGELGAGEVVAVHGDEGCYCGGWWVVGVAVVVVLCGRGFREEGSVVEGFCEQEGESGFSFLGGAGAVVGDEETSAVGF